MFTKQYTIKWLLQKTNDMLENIIQQSIITAKLSY